MVGDRLAAEDQLVLDETLHLVIGVLCGVIVRGMVGDWMTRLVLIGTGVVGGVLIILAFVLEQRLKAQLQAADNCRCISCTGDEA